MSQFLISIIIPCYNQELFLDQCLHSVYGQTFSNWECIIVDDGSTDHSKDIAEAWVKKDSRFRYFKKENAGLSSARNFGIEKHSGNWILFLDGDDIIHPEKLSESLKMNKGKEIVVTNFEMLNEGIITPPFSDITQYPITLKNIVRRWDIDFNIPVHCILIASHLIGDTRFREGIKAKEDWIFWVEIFSKQKEINVAFIDERLVQYRQHSNGISKNFENVYLANHEANEYLYNTSNQSVKNELFARLNDLNFSLSNEHLKQKNYIRKLQNTKILKYYLKLKLMLKK